MIFFLSYESDNVNSPLGNCILGSLYKNF